MPTPEGICGHNPHSHAGQHSGGVHRSEGRRLWAVPGGWRWPGAELPPAQHLRPLERTQRASGCQRHLHDRHQRRVPAARCRGQLPVHGDECRLLHDSPAAGRAAERHAPAGPPPRGDPAGCALTWRGAAPLPRRAAGRPWSAPGVRAGFRQDMRLPVYQHKDGVPCIRISGFCGR